MTSSVARASLYPDPSDSDFQRQLYSKRELHVHRAPDRPELKTYADIKQHRDNICDRHFALNHHQLLLSNFINPDTPYRGLLVFHHPGTGKTCVGISIAEKFKAIFRRYNTKATVLVNGPLIRESWKKQLVSCTGNTYVIARPGTNEIDEAATERNALQYYRFLSYKSFQKRVIGEKIVEHQTETGKAVYRKTEDGEFERDVSVDRIHNLDNSIIIVDEAHNLTGNSFGEALSHVIRQSTNLRVILLTGTPMKNLGSDIIELINFLRPSDSQIHADRVFYGDRGHALQFKPGGDEYLRNMMRGYISYLRGTDPITFAQRVDMGVKPRGLRMTKVTRCEMSVFQRAVYNDATMSDENDDALDRKSEAVANFVFPGLGKSSNASRVNNLAGYYGNDGCDLVKSQIKLSADALNATVDAFMTDNYDTSTDDADAPPWLAITSDNKSITGRILRLPYLETFSTKFATAIRNLTTVIGTAFIYSNLVRVGVMLFSEVLVQNGYLEYKDHKDAYDIKPNTRCYKCNQTYTSHINDHKGIRRSLNEARMLSFHKFMPATFIVVTGRSNEESTDTSNVADERINIIKNVFNNNDNRDGRHIKFVLGSRVMNEGISLFNVREVHILDAYYNFGRVDQVIARAIRYCSHYKLMSEHNVYPIVRVFKYVVTIATDTDDSLSAEEQLYQKAELKYLLIKRVERIMKEVAVDCALNRNANIFAEEVRAHANCELNIDTRDNLDNDNTAKLCPAECDHVRCDYKCDDVELNHMYYDPSRNIYKRLKRDDLDYRTFTAELARNEINAAKEFIKEMYIYKASYTLQEIIDNVRYKLCESDKYTSDDLFDEFFVFKALDELLPVTENDFNNFRDAVTDRHNRIGYLVHVTPRHASSSHYVFQPFDLHTTAPMYYRTNADVHVSTHYSLQNYLRKTYAISASGTVPLDESTVRTYYTYDDPTEYYSNRPENEYVGLIDKELSRRKNKTIDELADVFKIRERRSKTLEKRRATGLPSARGAVCTTAKNYEYLIKVMRKLDLPVPANKDGEISATRTDICSQIQETMMQLEKYATGRDKRTYVMIPTNHPTLPFPYNLEDRAQYIVDRVRETIPGVINIHVSHHKPKKSKATDISYTITVTGDTSAHASKLEARSFVRNDDSWTLTIN